MNPETRSADLGDFNPSHVDFARSLLAADIKLIYQARRISRWQRWRLLRDIRRATVLRLSPTGGQRRRRRLVRGARWRRRSPELPEMPQNWQSQQHRRDHRWQGQQQDLQDQRWQGQQQDWQDQRRQDLEPGLIQMVVQLLRRLLDRLAGTDPAPGRPEPGPQFPLAQERGPAWLADPGARYERRYADPYDSQNADKARIIEYMIAGVDSLRNLQQTWGDAAFPIATEFREDPRLTGERTGDAAREVTHLPRLDGGERTEVQPRAGTGRTSQATRTSTPPSPALDGRPPSPSVADMAAVRLPGHDSRPSQRHLDVSPLSSPVLSPVRPQTTAKPPGR